jgi:hypothetical protein
LSEALPVPEFDWLGVGFVGLFDLGGDCVGELGGNTWGSDDEVLLYKLYPNAAITATTKAITICVQGIDERVDTLRDLVLRVLRERVGVLRFWVTFKKM